MTESEIRQILSQYNISLVKMPGDGHCGYKAVALLLHSDMTKYQQVRDSVAQLSKSSEASIRNDAFMDDECRQLLSVIYDCPVAVYQILHEKVNQVSCFIDGKCSIADSLPTENGIHFLHSNDHFDLLVPTSLYNNTEAFKLAEHEYRMSQIQDVKNQVLTLDLLMQEDIKECNNYAEQKEGCLKTIVELSQNQITELHKVCLLE
jgi:transcription initiation factor TFIIIB Brf1 subunit/transcription initiation factor TFIIB